MSSHENQPKGQFYLHHVVTEMGDELVIYDKWFQKVHHLNAAAATAYRAYDQGRMTPAEMAADFEPLTDSREAALKLAVYTLEEMTERGIFPKLEREKSGLTRRDFIAKWGMAAAAVPVVTSVLMPVPAQANSTGACITCTDPAGEDPGADCVECEALGGIQNGDICQNCGVSTAGSNCGQANSANCCCMDCAFLGSLVDNCQADIAADPNPIKGACIDLNAMQDSRVNPDCCAARTAAATEFRDNGNTAAYMVVLCGGGMYTVPDGSGYFCCSNCNAMDCGGVT